MLRESFPLGSRLLQAVEEPISPTTGTKEKGGKNQELWTLKILVA